MKLEYTDEELKKMGSIELGHLMGLGIYKGEEWARISYYHMIAKKENR